MSPSSSTAARICARPITALLRTAGTTGGRRQPQMADTARSGVLTFGRRTTPLSREGRGERDQFCGERLNPGLPWPFAAPSAPPFLLLTTGSPSATRVAPRGAVHWVRHRGRTTPPPPHWPSARRPG